MEGCRARPSSGCRVADSRGGHVAGIGRQLRTLIVSALLLHGAVPAAGAVRARDSVLRRIAVEEDRRDWASGRLAAALRHPDAEVRERAVLAVGRLQDSTSVPALLPLLADRAYRV